MNYVLKSNHRNTRSFLPRVLKIVIGLLVVLSVLYIFFPRVLPAFFTAIVRPFWNIEQDIRYGASSVEELRKIYREEASNHARNSAIYQENEDLKKLLGRSTVNDPLLATILKKPPFSAYDTFILDVGENHGVAKGDRVYALGNIPIGEIGEVIGNTSKVLLYSSSGEKFDILIGTSSIQATAVGKGGGYFETSLPRESKITVGDTVLVPTFSNSFVGKVEGIASEPSEPFSKILFRQPVNIYELRWVLVEKRNI